MKRNLFMLATVFMLSTALVPSQVSAHGHNKACTISSCHKTGTHKHNGTTYSGHHTSSRSSHHSRNHH